MVLRSPSSSLLRCDIIIIWKFGEHRLRFPQSAESRCLPRPFSCTLRSSINLGEFSAIIVCALFSFFPFARMSKFCNCPVLHVLLHHFYFLLACQFRNSYWYESKLTDSSHSPSEAFLISIIVFKIYLFIFKCLARPLHSFLELLRLCLRPPSVSACCRLFPHSPCHSDHKCSTF